MMYSGGCDPGMVAVTLRNGSVSSYSGEGSASGERFTRAAAHRMVATVVCKSVLLDDDEDPPLKSKDEGDNPGVLEKEFRKR